MVFSELRFFVFIAIVFCVHWLLKNPSSRKNWLLASSYFFYGVWDARFLALILFSTVVDFQIGKWLVASQRESHRKLLLIASLVVNLGLLGFFKYFNFFTDSLVDLGLLLGLEISSVTLEILLPVGISFYTFQTLSYSIDIYNRKLEAVKDFRDFALFVVFFPQLVAGPIVRACDFLPQLKQPSRWNQINFQPLLFLFLVGFFKKACVSDNISPYVDICFQHPADFNCYSLWLAVILYSIQIYCDFSGYSDMAIAVAGMLGYKLPKNFDAPYLSTGIVDFWRRWHMSLSFWLRDYLYIPLGGNRKGVTRTYINLMITMVLGGLWHGASWNFVIWGALHGIALCASRVFNKQVSNPFMGRDLLGWAFTYWWVCLAWILFRAESLENGYKIALAWSTGHSQGSTSLPDVLWLHVIVLFIAHVVFRRYQLIENSNRLPTHVFAFLAGGILALMFAIASNSYQPFIYFQF